MSAMGGGTLAAGRFALYVAAAALLLALVLMERRVRRSRRDAAAARESESRYRAIFEHELDGVFILDDDGRFVDVNPAACALTGRTRQDLLGRHADEISGPDTDFSPAWETFHRDGEYAGDWRFRRPDGSIREVELTAKASFLPGRHLAMARDVTDRKWAEAQVRLRESQLAEAQAVARLGSWDWQPLGARLEWSDEHYRIFGLDPRHGATYQTIIAQVVAEDRARVEAAVRRSLDLGDDFELDYRILRTDGQIRTLHSRGHVEKGAAGTAAHLVGVVQDVTERALAEEALRESEERYRALFEAGPLPRLLYDPASRRILAVNRSAVELYGYGRDELVRMTIFELLPAEDVELLQLLFKRPLPDFFDAGVWRHRTRDGAIRFAHVTGSAVVLDGSPLRIISVADVTDKRQIEERLQRSNEELHALSERLLAVREEESARIAREVHDEIAQMLAALRLDVAWLDTHLASPFAPRQPELARKLRRMSALLDNAVDVVQRIMTDLRPGILDELGLAAAADWYVRDFEERLGIACSVAFSLDDATLGRSLSTALFRILQESLANVERHAAATRVDIRLAEEEHRLLLRVSDDGRGIPPEKIRDLRSLGLLGMRERARAHGGSVAVRRGEPKGTVVEATFPR